MRVLKRRWDPEELIKTGDRGNTDAGEWHIDCGRWEAKSQGQARQEQHVLGVACDRLSHHLSSLYYFLTPVISGTNVSGNQCIYQEALKMLGLHTNPILSHDCTFQVCAQLNAEATFIPTSLTCSFFFFFKNAAASNL